MDPAQTTFGLALLATTLAFGLRHGVDWDHIAAITDITGSQESPRRGMVLATLYVLGHAAVVLALGVSAILFAERLPPVVDAAMERVVGITLVVLGTYVLYSLARHGRDFRMRSRWMVVFAAVRSAARWLRRKMRRRYEEIVHDHPHPVDEPHHGSRVPAPVPASVGGEGSPSTHHHVHRHRVPVPEDPFLRYGAGSAFAVGMIHGVGAETPTQVMLFVTAAGVGGALAGVTLLVVFVIGLVVSNTVITLVSGLGFVRPDRSFRAYAALSVLTGVFSLAIGGLFLAGRGGVLPAFFGG